MLVYFYCSFKVEVYKCKKRKKTIAAVKGRRFTVEDAVYMYHVLYSSNDSRVITLHLVRD